MELSEVVGNDDMVEMTSCNDWMGMFEVKEEKEGQVWFCPKRSSGNISIH